LTDVAPAPYSPTGRDLAEMAATWDASDLESLDAVEAGLVTGPEPDDFEPEQKAATRSAFNYLFLSDHEHRGAWRGHAVTEL
jgi:hypothetical protein